MEFLYPNVLWAVMLPIFVLAFLILTNKDSMELIFSDEVLSKLAVNRAYMSKNVRNALFFAALIFMTLSLGRPVIDKKEHDVKQELIPLVIAVDVSRSMLARDLYPSRLELAKRKLKSIIARSKNSALGVILFARSAFVLSPITQDFASLMFLVDNLDSGLNFDNGSNIMGMIEAANDLMREFESKNIILLSDGGNSDNLSSEIAYAKENNINIYAVGLATKRGNPIPLKEGGYLTDSAGDIVTVKLNEAVKDLALKTGGGYIEYSLSESDIKAILNEISTGSGKDRMESQKVKIYTELFYYPLAAALFLLLLAFSSFPRFKTLKPH